MPTTGNLLELVKPAATTPYKELMRGHIFTLPGDKDFYIKAGTKAVCLRNGSERSMDQATMIVSLPKDTVIQITIGDQT